MNIDLVVETPISTSHRIRQLEGMFDVPRTDVSRLEWHGEIDLDFDWNVGLIVGPSDAGKSSVARALFGDEKVEHAFEWGKASVIDDFDAEQSMQDVAAVCQAVGFNTIPAWMRPYNVLSNGERFRVDLARRLLEQDDPIVVDEFTSVVDRQVAQIGSHAVQKYVRRHDRKFVAVSCHYDIVDWLQPDWILEPATMTLERRSVQSRPALDVTVAHVEYSAWRTFSAFHYLTAELNRAAQCFVLFVGDRPASFAAVLHRPHAKVRDIKGVSRLVTLPDWQGMGLAFVLAETLGAAYKTFEQRLHTYPAHPVLIRGFDKSSKWSLEKRPGSYSPRAGKTSTAPMGGRPCAVFRYVGEAMNRDDAARLLGK